MKWLGSAGIRPHRKAGSCASRDELTPICVAVQQRGRRGADSPVATPVFTHLAPVLRMLISRTSMRFASKRAAAFFPLPHLCPFRAAAWPHQAVIGHARAVPAFPQ